MEAIQTIQTMISQPVQAESDSPQVKAPGKKAKAQPGSSPEEFAGVLGQAAVPVVPAATTQISGAAAQQAAAQAEKNSATESAKQSGSKPLTGREITGMNEKVAVSANTASAMTGLNPWSKDWVFRQDESVDPQKVSLLGKEKGAPKAPQASAPMTGAEVQAALAAMGLQGMENAQTMEGLSTPKGAKNSTRGPTQGSETPNGVAGLTAAAMAQNPKMLEGVMKEGLNVESMEMGPTSAPNRKTPKVGNQSLSTQNLSGSEFLDTLQGAQSSSLKKSASLRPDSLTGAQPLSMNAPSQGPVRKLHSLPEGLNSSQTDLTAGAAALSQIYPRENRNVAQPLAMPVVAGQVTQGAGTRDRLTNEGLMNVGEGIRNLQAQGGGEMKVRLKPDNLGELVLKVRTRGQDVGIQIHASDDKAKKVIEESLSYLKDSLASQNLNLSRVDVALTPAVQSGMSSQNDPQSQSSAQQQYQQQQAAMENGREGSSNSQHYDEEAPGTVRPLASNIPSSSSSVSSNRRLDVRA